MVGIHFRNSAHDNRNWDKIYDNLTEKIYIWNRMQLSLREKNNHKPNLLIKTMVHRSSIYYSKMYLEKNWKENKGFAMVSCSRFIWITNSSDHRRVCQGNLLSKYISNTTPSQFEKLKYLSKRFPLDQQNIRPPRHLAQLPIFEKVDWVFQTECSRIL